MDAARAAAGSAAETAGRACADTLRKTRDGFASLRGSPREVRPFLSSHNAHAPLLRRAASCCAFQTLPAVTRVSALRVGAACALLSVPRVRCGAQCRGGLWRRTLRAPRLTRGPRARAASCGSST